MLVVVEDMIVYGNVGVTGTGNVNDTLKMIRMTWVINCTYILVISKIGVLRMGI